MPNWLTHLQLPGKIWKLEIDAPRALLALEVRQADPRGVSFWTISLKNLQTFPQLVHATDDWWVGLAGCRNGVLLLQGYQDPGLPLPQGIMAHDLDSGHRLWQDPQRTLAHLLPDQVLTRQETRPSLRESLDLRTGAVSQLSDEAWHDLAGTASPSEAMAFPQLLSAAEPAAAPHRSQIEAHYAAVPQAHLAIDTYGSYHILAWYRATEGNSLTHWLSVWRHRKFVADTQLAPQTTQLALDSFMRFDRWLIAYHADGSLSLGEMEGQ